MQAEIFTILPNVPAEIAVIIRTVCLLYFVILAPKRFSKIPTGLIILCGGVGLFYVEQEFNAWLHGVMHASIYRSDNALWYMLASYGLVSLIMCVMLITTTTYKIQNSIYIVGIAMMLAEAISSTGCLLYAMFLGQGIARNPFLCIFAYSIWAFIILFIYAMLNKEHKDFYRENVIRGKSLLLMLVIVFMTYFLSNSEVVTLGYPKQMAEYFSIYITRMLGSVCGLVAAVAVQTIYQEDVIKQEMVAIRNTLNQQYQQYLMFRETSEYIARQNHDLKHQIEALEASSDEERQAVIQEMKRAMELNQSWTRTGNTVLDVMLTQKKMQCVNRGIQMSISADATTMDQFAVRDICSLFGNILDNAIEAVSGLDKDRRVIRGMIQTKKSFLLIKFENCYDGDPITDNQLPKTKKAEKYRHGYGLKSIRYITEKYDGSLRIEAQNGWFTLQIMMPMNEKERCVD